MTASIRSSTLPLLKYTRTRILQSRHGLYVELRPNGSLRSTRDIRSPYIFLQFLTVGTNMVAIWGVDSRLYLAIDEDGTVFTTKAESKECVFREHVTREFFSQYQTCHKNEDELAWNLCLDKSGKITATPAIQGLDKNLDFIVKLPAEQAIFCRTLTRDTRGSATNPYVKSRDEKRTASLSFDENTSRCAPQQHYGSVVRRAFSRGVGQSCDSRASMTHSSSDSQYSRSEMSYSFTDSMEIACFTSDSSLESFLGM